MHAAAVRERRHRQRDEIAAHAVAGIRIPQLAEPGVCRSPARVLASQEGNQTSAGIVRRRSQGRSGDRGKLSGDASAISDRVFRLCSTMS